jgi:hypothetical protein
MMRFSCFENLSCQAELSEVCFMLDLVLWTKFADLQQSAFANHRVSAEAGALLQFAIATPSA